MKTRLIVIQGGEERLNYIVEDLPPMMIGHFFEMPTAVLESGKTVVRDFRKEITDVSTKAPPVGQTEPCTVIIWVTS
jgi:hypothetical protein